MFRSNSTNAMLKVLDDGIEDLNTLLDTLVARRDAAIAASKVTLPAQTESGESVVHGARVRCVALVEMYQDMIYAMKRRVDDLGDPTLRTPMEAK
jgi:hypothetical protein